MYSELRFHKLFRGNSFIFVKGFYEVAFVIEAAGNSGFLDGDIFGGQHFTSAFDSIVIQIVNRGSFRNASEIAAKILGIHTGNFGECL